MSCEQLPQKPVYMIIKGSSEEHEVIVSENEG